MVAKGKQAHIAHTSQTSFTSGRERRTKGATHIPRATTSEFGMNENNTSWLMRSNFDKSKMLRCTNRENSRDICMHWTEALCSRLTADDREDDDSEYDSYDR